MQLNIRNFYINNSLKGGDPMRKPSMYTRFTGVIGSVLKKQKLQQNIVAKDVGVAPNSLAMYLSGNALHQSMWSLSYLTIYRMVELIRSSLEVFQNHHHVFNRSMVQGISR
jgi:hypothetical protein